MGEIPVSALVNLGLGGLVLVGGAYGYLKKGSKASLLAGLAIGSLLMGSGYLIVTTDLIYEAHILATSGLMAYAMGDRYVSTGKFMPAGLVAMLGAIGCAYNLNRMGVHHT
jgi:uncharacterized membrane protein (UPF0136 family)